MVEIDICRKGHRVHTELNPNIEYTNFCPVCDENMYSFELAKATLDEKVAHEIISSHGEIEVNSKGEVLKHTIDAESVHGSEVVFVDLIEYERFWGNKPSFEIDILDVRCILATGEVLEFSNYRNSTRG